MLKKTVPNCEKTHFQNCNSYDLKILSQGPS